MRWASASFPGQYAMVVLSRFPIDANARAHLPQIPVARHAGRAVARRPATPAPRTGIRPRSSPCCRCPRRATGMCRCASAGRRCTCSRVIRRRPPSMAPEDRNGRRNHDEIRFWSDYLSTERPDYIRDDAGRARRFHGQGVHHHGRPELRSGRWRQPAMTPSARCSRIRASNAQFVPQSAGAAEASAVAGRRQRRATRRSALRHRRLQRSRRRQPARRLSTAVEGHCTVCGRRRILAGAGRSGRGAGVGRPPAAELGSPARVARRQCRRSSMPTGQ